MLSMALWSLTLARFWAPMTDAHPAVVKSGRAGRLPAGKTARE